MSSGPRREGEKFEVYKNRLKMEEKYMRQRIRLGPAFDMYLINRLKNDKNNTWHFYQKCYSIGMKTK